MISTLRVTKKYIILMIKNDIIGVLYRELGRYLIS